MTVTEDSAVTEPGSDADGPASTKSSTVDIPALLADPLDGRFTEPLTGRRIGRTCLEMLAATVVAVLVDLPMQFVIDRLHVPRPSYVFVAMTALVGVVLLAAMLWLVIRRAFGTLSTVAIWVGLAALNTAVLSFMLNGSKFYLGGLSSDQSFRTEYLTRLTDSASVKDFAFQGVPSYYPSGWFWLGGRFANVFGLAGWAAYKPFAILTIAVAAVLAYAGWALVAPRRTAVLLALGTSTVGVATWAAAEPYAWAFGALIPPMAAVAWRYLTRLDSTMDSSADGSVDGSADGSAGGAGRSSRWAPGIFLGAYVGLLALFYTLLFVFFTVVVVLTALVGLAMCKRAGHPLWPVTRRAAARLALAGGAAIVVAAVHWGPYLAGYLTTPVKQSAATRILPEFGGQFPTPIGLSDFVSLLSLAGLVWLVVRIRDGVLARSLALVLATGYLWYGVSMLGIPAMVTLLPYKIELIMDEVFRCAGVLALVDGARWLGRRLAASPAARQWRRTALASVLVVGLLGTVGILQTAADGLDPLPGQAFSDYYPTGYTALGKRDPSQSGAWNQQLHDTIANLTGRPEHDLVVLSDYQDILSFWPYWSFETSIIEYANPLADFYNRRAAIQSWARAGSPGQLLTDLDHAPFAAPDVFVFTRKPDGLHMTVTRNVFPAYPQIEATQVVFSPTLFDSPAFERRDVGPYTIVVRRAGNP